MSAQHTPGPWVVVWSPKTGRPVGIDAPNDADIPGAVGGVVRQNGIGMPGSALGCANARLIAAAPDMLAALREISDSIIGDDVPGRELRAIARTARAAIAKAEGR